jgi:excisionase family DNA binding protein
MRPLRRRPEKPAKKLNNTIEVRRRKSPLPEPSTTIERAAFSIAEFCAQTGVGKDSAYAAIRKGDLVAVKLGKRTLVTAKARDEFIANLPRLELT